MVKTIGLALLAGLLATAPTSIDLTGPFHTRTPWRFTATQGPAVPDTFGGPGATAPGKFTLCLSRDGQKNCEGTLLHTLGNDADGWSGPHFLRKADIEQPDGRPLFVVQSAGLWSGDGDYGIESAAFRYDPRQDRFILAYQHGSEHNRNGNVRYVEDGPLRGDIVSVDATEDAPFGYWVVVNRLGPDDTYHPILRYRSNTRYGDGNPLAVIDSEMPEIERRLHLWHAGQPLPLPPGPCARPHLVRGALWCQ